MRERTYWVYILGSKSGTLYTGMSGSLKKRVSIHKQHLVKGFTDRYKVTRLLYYEAFTDVWACIRREKEIKGWKREKKIALIDSVNAAWEDLSEGWYEDYAKTR
jgi:putative endonuclease